MTISVGRCLKRKTMLVWVKEYINKNFATCKSLCNLQELYTAFKEKHPNVNIGFSKFFALRPKWCVLAGSKMTHSVSVCSAHQNVRLLGDAMDWTWYTKTWSRRLFATLRATNASWIGVNPFLAAQLWNNFLINEIEDDEKSNYCQWDTTDWAILTNFTATYEEYKETLIDVIDDLIRHSYIAKLKITSSWYRTKSKATTGVNNTASYIPWLYTTRDQMVASNIVHCVLVLMTATIIQAFGIKFKQCLFIILKLIIHIQ